MYSWLSTIINNTSFLDIIVLKIPPHKRQFKRIALLQSFAKPLVELFETFKAYRNATLYELHFDGSTIHFEKFLNDAFNNGASGIVIITNETSSPLFIPGKDYGGDPEYIADKAYGDPPIYIGDKTWYENQYDFTVQIPAALYSSLDLNEVKAFINKYKLAGMSYQIESV